ncbi:MAG: hypothetical protein QXY62_03825 [Candidatus Altiarchaeota archaeon]
MKIPGFFKKEKKEQEEIDMLIQQNIAGEGEKVDEPQEETPPTEFSGQIDELRKMRMDVDKLIAEFEVVKQINKVNEERFQRISEEIGELRRANVERERDINKIMVKAEKAAQLVEQVQPEKLMMEVEKEDAKIQTIEAKEKADKSLIDYITKEIKDIRATLETFRGVESLIELNEEVKRELMNMKKLQTVISQHADKVENIFVKTQKTFSDLMKLSQEFRVLENRFDDLMKDSENLKANFESVAKKEDLNSLQKEFNDKLSSIEKIKEDLEKKKKELDEILPEIRESLKESKKLEEIMKRRVTEIDDELTELSKIEQKRYVTEEKFNKELGDFFKSILEKIEALEQKIK